MNDDEDSRTGLKRALDSLWIKLPELVLATIGGLGVIVFSTWLGLRDAGNRLDEIDSYIEHDQKHMEALADCVKRPECEAVRAIVQSHELRLAATETRIANHEQISRERVERITELEREMRRVTTQPTGTEGRVLRDQIDALQRQLHDIRTNRGQEQR